MNALNVADTKKSVSSTGIPTIADQDDDGGIMFEVHDDSKGPHLCICYLFMYLFIVICNFNHRFVRYIQFITVSFYLCFTQASEHKSCQKTIKLNTYLVNALCLYGIIYLFSK